MYIDKLTIYIYIGDPKGATDTLSSHRGGQDYIQIPMVKVGKLDIWCASFALLAVYVRRRPLLEIYIRD